MDILGGHITLCQQVNYLPLFIDCHVHNDHGMARGPASDQNITNFHIGKISYGFKLLLQGYGTAPCENFFKIDVKMSPVSVCPHCIAVVIVIAKTNFTELPGSIKIFRP